MTRNYDSNNVFMKIIKRRETAKIEYETSDYLVIHDINPQATTHLLLIPKNILKPTLDAATDAERALVFKYLNDFLGVLHSRGFNAYSFCCNNIREQQVFHIHVHILSTVPISLR